MRIDARFFFLRNIGILQHMEVHMTTKDELKASNQSAKFWELEQPEIMETRFNTLRYYPKAQRLVVHNKPDVIDRLIEILQSIKPY